MRNIKLIIEYDGSRYDGWVEAKNGSRVKNGAVSDKIVDVLKEMEQKDTELIGAIRTEAGVHAYRQVATFKTDSEKSPLEIKRYLNRYLPRDIAVLEASEADERFHPAFNAKGFTFEYRITVGDVPSVFERKYNYYCFKNPDVDRMKKAAAFFIGKHDFAGFSDNKRMKKSTVREITALDIYKSGNEISFTVSGDDFWPNMVRIMIALLIEIGTGEKEATVIPKIFETGDRSLAPEAIDSKGLFLTDVKYE
ncbi:MAG: tRNA pseudouridine(38-40) synthase TruA [Lachnospiraceae bacterium]|nr:tRNA pseudouridine(38-40) synthase TruA [Lachnospiraceae bacterium]